MRRAGMLAAGVLALAAAGVQAAPATRVQILVAGKSRTLGGPVTVRAGGKTVTVGGRRCAIAGATPLAALAALRGAGGPAFALRDYGHCGKRAADAASLYVRSIGPDRAAGPNGWVYKVRRKVPGAAAGDPAGVRLRPRERVLWFYCRMGAHGCQRTLELTVPGAAAAGAPLTATVRGYDDNGRGVGVAGATVALAGATVQTGAGGVATLTAPMAPGRYIAAATAPGLVAAFPSEVTVG